MKELLKQERAGTLPEDKAVALAEARRRGLVPAAAKRQTPVDPRGTTLPRTALEQFGQGATFGFGDEISDRIGAGIASVATDESYDDLLAEARASTRERLPAQFEENPKTSILANLAGGVATGGAAAGAVKGVAPNVASNLAKFAAANPLKAASAIGGVSGGIYGVGGGEGGVSERLEGAIPGAAMGAAAGPVGSIVGTKVITPLAGKLAKSKAVQGGLAKTAKLFEKKGKTGKALVDKADDFTPAIAAKEGDIFPKTAGQRTQDPYLQRLENDARAGTITPASEDAMRVADVQQNRALHGFLDEMSGGLDKGKDINALVEGAADVVKKGAGLAKADVNSAYELARAGSGGVKIKSGDIRKGLWTNIADMRRNEQYDLSQMPGAKSVLKRLAGYSKRDKLSSVSSVKLGELENFRKQATNAANSTQDQTEKRFLKGMVKSYDNYMEQTAKDAVDIGDANAINAFRGAVSKRAEYGRLFEKNKFVDDIVHGEQSVDDVVKTLIGTGSIKGKRAMADNFDALIKASKGESDIVKADLRQAFTKKAFDKSVIGLEANNPNMERISPAKLGTELENIFVHQSKFAEKLYGKEAVKAAKQAIGELNLIASAQSNTRNPSGSGEWVGRFMKNAFVNKVPGMGLLNSAVEAQQQNIAGGVVERGLKEFMDESFKPKSAMWSTVVPVGAAAVANMETEKPPVLQPRTDNTLADRIATSLQNQQQYK